MNRSNLLLFSMTKKKFLYTVRVVLKVIHPDSSREWRDEKALLSWETISEREAKRSV